ncbi:hypothetical protein B0T20DRAFT_246688 [Sordaria brevicollis]|uniref:Uncharacterized protein n=1 Tax=Sordaria brevicollis TaxID=83679 RepID=A0AAE0PBN3_SORBR|nr:hypothetical protein B0T20DRAFT_246688 [Sordaria brevicollis]
MGKMKMVQGAATTFRRERKEEKEEKAQRKKTYNTRDSLVVTDPTTSLALTGLSMGERTGSRVFQWVWSYVVIKASVSFYLLALSGWHRRTPAFGGSTAVKLAG